MNIKDQIIIKLEEIVKELTKDGSASSPQEIKVELSIPSDDSHGDYSSNVAMRLAKQLGRNPLEIAQQITEMFESYSSSEQSESRSSRQARTISKVEAVKPGFINFYLSKDALLKNAEEVLENPEKRAITNTLEGKRIMVEYAHPNTHKEAHIGHTRTLVTGEAISRLFEGNGAIVFRANYQGDVGPHVAKAVYGIQKMLREENKTLDDFEKYTNLEKVHFLGTAYALGNSDYEAHKEEIDSINKLIYQHGEGNPELWEIYQRTRTWSLDYYEDLYKRFYVKFDRLFFETEMADEGPRIVRENIGNVFVQDPDGSVYFPGEKYGLHTRVFITKAGTPTYEGKEMANAMLEAETFPFDLKAHIVGSEQAGYFQVVFKALELIDPKQFVGKQFHLPTGIVQLKDRKMSSRTGDVFTYDKLIDEIKEKLDSLLKDEELSDKEKEDIKEKIAIGAIKYSMLRVGTRQNVSFDINTSISTTGDSGAYVQYTYTRTHSVLEKALDSSAAPQNDIHYPQDYTPNDDELKLLRLIQKFGEVVETAAITYSPNVVTEYVFNLSQLFNNFYQKYRILNAADPSTPDVEGSNTSGVIREFRLALTATVGIVLKQGLHLLGIAAPEKM